MGLKHKAVSRHPFQGTTSPKKEGIQDIVKTFQMKRSIKLIISLIRTVKDSMMQIVVLRVAR